MFEKLEQLAKDNKKISDFHIRSGSPSIQANWRDN